MGVGGEKVVCLSFRGAVALYTHALSRLDLKQRVHMGRAWSHATFLNRHGSHAAGRPLGRHCAEPTLLRGGILDAEFS